MSIKFAFDPISPHRTLTTKKVLVYIDKLVLNLHDTSNDSLLRPMQGLIAFVLKQKIRDAMQTKIVEIVSEIDAPITEMKNKMMGTIDGMSGGVGAFESVLRRLDPTRSQTQTSKKAEKTDEMQNGEMPIR